MIHQFSQQIIKFVLSSSKQTTDDDQLEVYDYGLECFINTVVPVILLTIWSGIFHSLFETWLWITTFTILRKYTGGYHAPTQIACMIFSTILGIGNTLAIQLIRINIDLKFSMKPTGRLILSCRKSQFVRKNVPSANS